MIELKDVSAMRGSPRGHFSPGKICEINPADLERSRGGAVDSGDEIEKSSLPRSRGSHEGEKFPFGYVEIECLEGGDGDLALSVGLADLAAGDE